MSEHPTPTATGPNWKNAAKLALRLAGRDGMISAAKPVSEPIARDGISPQQLDHAAGLLLNRQGQTIIGRRTFRNLDPAWIAALLAAGMVEQGPPEEPWLLTDWALAVILYVDSYDIATETWQRLIDDIAAGRLEVPTGTPYAVPLHLLHD